MTCSVRVLSNQRTQLKEEQSLFLEGKVLWSKYFYIEFLFRIDVNNDGVLTEEEFLRGCLEDEELSMMLSQSNAMAQANVAIPGS